jgi:hypothetical protein
MRRFVFVAGAVVGFSAWLPACGDPVGQTIARTPTVEGVDEGQATCKVAKDPLNPLVVEWPGTSKVSLDSASRQGVVVVSYVGCVLKVLTSCQAGGTYELRQVTPVRDKVSIENETDLYARLPLGVASLKGELKTGQRLDLEYVAVGQREAATSPVSLAGECAGATHYVRSIMVGAYGLDVVGTGKATVVASAGEVGGGAERKESVRRIRGSGDVAKCAADESSHCGAVLQLGLAPLSVSGGAVTSGGFGAGLGALTVVPTVREVTTVGAGATSLAKADVALLGLFQDAKRADKAQVPFDQKAAAWAKLAAYPGENPYKELAEKRRDEWKLAAEAEVRRKEQVVKVCRQHATDSAKLAELLRLDDEVVTAKQKTAYRAELAQVYAPYAEALEECKRDARTEAEARSRKMAQEAEAQQRKEAEEARAKERAALAANPMLCGRYKVLDEGNGGDGSGAVRDTQTGLTWLRQQGSLGKDHRQATAYCASRGMRLPSYQEALAIAGPGRDGAIDGRCKEAWPQVWWTWTSSTVSGGKIISLEMNRNVFNEDSGYINIHVGALCVR